MRESWLVLWTLACLIAVVVFALLICFHYAM